jgi:hypothetical protein
MNHKHRIARYIALVVGGLLCVVGVLHDIVNIPSLTRALARGEIAERMGPQLVANVALAGLALALLGVLLLLIGPDLAKGKHAAWRIGIVIGLFLVLSGVAAYLWQPRARVLIFSALGGLICGPLLIWRKEFLVE